MSDCFFALVLHSTGQEISLLSIVISQSMEPVIIPIPNFQPGQLCAVTAGFPTWAGNRAGRGGSDPITSPIKAKK